MQDAIQLPVYPLTFGCDIFATSPDRGAIATVRIAVRGNKEEETKLAHAYLSGVLYYVG